MNSFVDRDMFMRYYWGLAAGHTYTHSTENDHPQIQSSSTSISVDENDDPEPETSTGDSDLLNHLPERDVDVQHDNNPEFGFDNRQDDLIDDEAEIDGYEGGIDNDDEFIAITDMYGVGHY